MRVIDTSSDLTSYTQRTTLDGREYLLTLTWNQRSKKWYLSVADQDEIPIIEGVKVVADFPLLRLLRGTVAPPGEIIAMDTSGEGIDPGQTDLGSRVLLLYYDAEEVVEMLDALD